MPIEVPAEPLNKCVVSDGAATQSRPADPVLDDVRLRRALKGRSLTLGVLVGLCVSLASLPATARAVQPDRPDAPAAIAYKFRAAVRHLEVARSSHAASYDRAASLATGSTKVLFATRVPW